MKIIHRREHATAWLADRLADGPVTRADLIAEARAVGISRNALLEAADILGVISTPLPVFPRRTEWKIA